MGTSRRSHTYLRNPSQTESVWRIISHDRRLSGEGERFGLTRVSSAADAGLTSLHIPVQVRHVVELPDDILLRHAERMKVGRLEEERNEEGRRRKWLSLVRTAMTQHT